MGGGNIITYNLRTPVETGANNSVGVTGENNSYTAKFLIGELSDKNLTFRIHLRFADGSVNTVVPDEVSVDDAGTLIVWNVKKTDIFIHGFFELQIEGRKSDDYVFQTEIVRMYADESIPVEDKEYENPNSETINLREEAYEFLCELKLQQDRLDENMRLLLATDITSKADKTELTAGLKTKQNATSLSNTVTSIDELIAFNSTDTVYRGTMSGFSTKFGASSDSVTKGFRMWFVLSKPYNNYEWYRIIMLDDGSVWTASKTGTTFTQIIYNKTQINKLLKSKADTATTLAGYGITDAYTKTEVDTAFLNNTTTIYLRNTITDIDSFLECDSTDKIYIGMMKGFSTTFGYSSDTEYKGFRMWFIPELVSGEETSTEIGTPIVQSWHRVVMFEDGTIWTAPFRNTTFTQISYSKTQVENLLSDKAGLDAYENVVRLSKAVYTADRLNDCTNANKTYILNVAPPMSTDLAISTGCNCIVNCYDNLTQILRTVRYQNKVFIREYNSTSDTWSDFKEITIPDKAVTKEKLSADLQTELAGKYNASNVEYGSGTLTGATGYENETATFNYQKVGNLVTVIGKATFSGENTTLVRLAGLPYRSTAETMYVYTQFRSSKSKWMMVNTNYSVLEVRHSTSGQVFEAEETLRFAISYYTA